MKAKFKALTALACAAVCAFSFAACNVNGKTEQTDNTENVTDVGNKEITDNGNPAPVGDELTGTVTPVKVPDVSKEEITGDDFSAFKKRVDKFSSAFSASVYENYQGNDNIALSPISVYSALSLAAECADGQTRTEILNALGVSYEQLHEHFPALYDSLNKEYKADGEVTSTVKLGNSVWVNEGTEVRQDCIDALSDYYYGSSYSADFRNDNAAANQAIRDFVKEQTNGLIDKDFNLNTETLFALINTLYLKTIWNTDGNDLTVTEDKYDFVCKDGTVKNTNLLQGYYTQGRIHETESYSTFYTKTCNGYKIKFILPKDGYTVDDVFTAENIYNVNSIADYGGFDAENNTIYSTRCIFPEFKSSYDGDIIGVLKANFGIDLLFDSQNCDFSSLTDESSYCSSIKHVTKLTVDKTGIEGAAVTVIAGEATSVGPSVKYVYDNFVVDKAFGFIITDNQNVTLFSGVVNGI